MTTDDKPAPGIRVHVAAGAELDRLAETLDVRPREGASEWRPHPETDVDLRGRILARLGAMPPRGPSPQHGFVDPLDIPCPTHKVPAGQVCGFLDGDGAACCWRIIAAGPPMPESAIEYDNQCRPINVRHVSLNSDGSFTMAYDEGAMDPVKPRKPVSLCRAPVENATGDTAPCYFSLGHPGEHDPNAHVHPAPNLPPWRWEEKDGRRWLVDGNGHPVPTGRIVGDKIVDSHESELQRAAPEMAKLLREWKGYSGWVHADCDCLYCRIMRVLARIDEAAR